MRRKASIHSGPLNIVSCGITIFPVAILCNKKVLAKSLNSECDSPTIASLFIASYTKAENGDTYQFSSYIILLSINCRYAVKSYSPIVEIPRKVDLL